MQVLTFMFTDLVGSTEILSRLGEARADAVRRKYFGLLREATRASGGRELKALDDGVMLAFESPSNAVECAAAMQRAFARHNVHAVERLDVRIGLDAGEAILASEQYQYADSIRGPVAVARRLCDAALGGQILVSSLVQVLAAPHAAAGFETVGLLELDGLPDRVAAFEVLWEQARRAQPPLPPELSAHAGEPSGFVGRLDPRERLLHAWRSVEAGERRAALVCGEPGIGKTRLAAEFARGVHDAGGVVLWGRCFEEALTPYQPFVQALRHYVATCDPADLRGLPTTQIASLSRLLPELAAHVRADDPLALAPETERYRLFEATAGLLARAAADGPILLVLDDLQWADDATLLLLRALIDDGRATPILVLGTYRDSEVPRRHPLARLRADLERDRVVDLIELAGLSDTEVARLVDSLLGWKLPRDVAAAIHTGTEGNPFFLEEVVRDLEEIGGVADVDRLRTRVNSLSVPRRVKELVGRRVQRLSAAAAEALEIASVAGSEFRLDLLSAVLEQPEDVVVARLDDAVEAGLLTELPGRIGEYGFTHALVQQALYEEQSANRRASLHARIAERLEVLAPAAAATLAIHFSLAGNHFLDRVVRYSRDAGVQALEVLAYEDAAHEFERALAGLALLGDGRADEYAKLLLLLGSAQSRAGASAAAETAYHEACEIATRIGAATTLAQAALGYGGGTGFGGVWTKFALVDDVLVRFLEDALAALPREEERLKARVLGRLAEALYWGTEEDCSRALRLSEQALTVARALDDPVAIAYALDSRHVALWQPEYLEELTPIAEEMLRIGAEANEREIQLQAYAWLITDALERAPIHVADRYIQDHASIAHELGQPYHLWYAEVVRAMRAHLAGRYEDMADAVEAAWAHGQTAHGETAKAVHGIQLLHLQLETSATDELIGQLEANAAGSPLPAARAVLAVAYAGAGRSADALKEVAFFARDEFPAARRDCVWSSTLCFLAEVVARLDAVEYAAPLYRLLLPFADRNCVAGGAILVLGPISRFLGMLARVEGDHDRALMHLRHALARSRQLGSAPLAARTQLETAKVLADRDAPGDAQDVRALLDEVRTTARRLGMEPLAFDADAVAAAAAHGLAVQA